MTRNVKMICYLLVVLVPLSGCIPHRDTGYALRPAAADPPANAYYHYLASQLRQSEGARDKALEELVAAYRLDTDTPLLGRELAVLLVQSDDNDSALQVAEDTLKAHPDDINTLIIYGRIQQELKNSAAAGEAFEKVLALDPDQQSIYLHLGGLYLDDGNRDSAQAVFQRLVDRFPDSFAGYFYLGRIAASNGDDKTAEALFSQALAIKDDLDEPRFELVEIFKRQRRIDEAIALYRDLLTRNEDNLRAALGLGVLYYEVGKKQESRNLLGDIGRRFASDTRLARTIAGQYVDRKAYDAARIILEGVMPAQPDSPELLYLAGLTFEGLNDWETAVTYLRRIPASSGLYRDAAIHVAFIYQEKEKIDEAIDYLKGVLPNITDNAELYYYLGSLYEEKDALADAVQWLKQGLEKAPDDVKMAFRLGVVYDKQGNKEASIAQMQKTIALDPEHASALNYLGYTYADMGVKLDEAEALIKKALSIKPDDGYITDSLGWVYFKKGQFAEALEWLGKAVALTPEDPVILEHLGDAYHRTGDSQEALRYYRQALEKKTQDREPLVEKLRQIEGARQP
ncbi:MAG: tetratricopeptide repeat protein [Pseudomonadota bacterium]